MLLRRGAAAVGDGAVLRGDVRGVGRALDELDCGAGLLGLGELLRVRTGPAAEALLAGARLVEVLLGAVAIDEGLT
ncbi:MAG TPA: hypothetical protein VFL99_02035 [Segeticoccus sp.]|uniref:hypothetical protein n=1 Tax=Segeticoccus sp. TaxID=2706531 RepID=UPI002D7E2D59|nr:hypothetical protein [Segeticoccus sp.]HET8599076.1 hypothetical protein [Segeticoccus sp.]